jgi:transcription initiation factor TFIIH subunit 2
MEEEEGDKLYTWETKYEKTWEHIQEDAEGFLQAEDESEAYKIKRRKLFLHPTNMRLGMMRHMFLIVDCSLVMNDKDLKPNRLSCTLKVLGDFVTEFFDQNPISQLGIITSRNGKAEKLLELNGNPHVLMKSLEVSGNWTLSGEPSIQNALQMAMNSLKHVPSHASREVLFVMGSLTSCDPGNIFTTVEELSKQSVRVSIIGLAAEVKLCKTIAQQTRGSYSVIMSENHFKDLMIRHCRPPPAKANAEASLIKMGKFCMQCFPVERNLSDGRNVFPKVFPHITGMEP